MVVAWISRANLWSLSYPYHFAMSLGHWAATRGKHRIPITPTPPGLATTSSLQPLWPQFPFL